MSKLLDISEQDPYIGFEQSDFQEDLDSTVLVRERASGSKLQSIFDKKSGKTIKETAHTLTMLPKNSSKPKTYAKRDLAHLSYEQKAVMEKSAQKKRQMAERSSSESSQDRPTRKKPQKGKKRAAVAKSSTPKVAIEFDDEEEERPPAVEIEKPPIVDISSSTEGDQIKNSSGSAKVGKEEKEGTEQNPEKRRIPITATATWEIEKKPQTPTRVIERKRVPTKRYGIDLVQVENEAENLTSP